MKYKHFHSKTETFTNAELSFVVQFLSRRNNVQVVRQFGSDDLIGNIANKRHVENFS